MSGFALLYDSGPLAAPASSITATVDTSYRKFRVTLYGIKDATSAQALVRLNGDTGTNYSYQYLAANSTTVSGLRATGQTSIPSSISLGSNAPGLITIEIDKPLASTVARATLTVTTDSPAILYLSTAAEWNNTADLIDEIAISSSSGNFAAGTRMVVEGAAP